MEQLTPSPQNRRRVCLSPVGSNPCRRGQQASTPSRGKAPRLLVWHMQSEIQEKLEEKIKGISWQDPNYHHGLKARPAVRRHHVMAPIQSLLKTTSNLEEGVEKLEGEPRQWLFPGQPSEVRDCSPSSDRPSHARGRKPRCSQAARKPSTRRWR